MDSDAWRPFAPVDVKRQVAPARRDSSYCDYMWLAVTVVTFVTFEIDAEA
jgi:hypothetical protein